MSSVPSSFLVQSEIKRIVFSSRLNTQNTEDAEQILNFIYSVGEIRNPKEGIQALLYYNPETFNVVQLMEGPVDSINTLFRDIAQDRRHTRVSRIFDERITSDQKWCFELGIKHGSRQDWEALKRNLLRLKVSSNFTDVEPVDLELIDQLPLAGDLDLRMIRLVYHSKFKEQNFQRAFLLMQDVVEAAQRKNERLLIGGVLFMNKETFDVFQCLEGPANAVKSLYVSIENDSRHFAVETIQLETVESRRYKTWGMSWANFEATEQLKLSLTPATLKKYGHLMVFNENNK